MEPEEKQEPTCEAMHAAVDAIYKEEASDEHKAKKLKKLWLAIHEKEEAEPKEGEGEPEKKVETEEEIKAKEEAAASEREAHEQKPTDRGELFEQAAVAHPRIDRKAGVIRHVHVMGNQSKHGYRYSLEAQRAVAARYEGMPVGIDHDYQSKPMKVADTFGTLRNPTVDTEGTWADLHFLTRHEQAPAILEDIERGTGIFALSSVNGKVMERDGVVISFVPGRVDVVVGGATTRTVLEQAPAAIPTVSKAEHDALLKNFEQLQSKTTELEKRMILREQYVAPQSTLQQEIKRVEAASPVDMKAFWNTAMK